MTRTELLAAVNRHRDRRGAPPLAMRHWNRAVAYARQHRVASPEHIEWAQLGYFPTPAERART